jgi:hypothetical protein
MMDKNKQKIVIAEHCGWYEEDNESSVCWTRDDLTYCEPIEALPDYTQDLNAIHEAEKVLTDDQLFVMGRWLRHSTRSTLVGVAIMTANAPQRAEAFLKTLNKWEDSE